MSRSTNLHFFETSSRLRATGFCALILLTIICVAASKKDAISEFKSWFKKYKKGQIELYQASTVPLSQGDHGSFQYHKTDNLKEMVALLDNLSAQNDLKVTQLLVEAAFFRFDRNPEEEIKRHFKKQPWLLRAHALESLQKITDPQSLSWLRDRCLKSNSGWDAPFRRLIAASIFGSGRTQKDIELLKLLLKDREVGVREEALLGLAHLGRSTELNAVMETLNDPHPSVRVAAVEAIGGILAKAKDNLPVISSRCLAVVTPCLEDPEWAVQEAALTMLERFRSVKSIPVLIGFLEKINDNPQAYRERILQRAVEVLRSLTEAPISDTKPMKWKAWWSENRESFELAPVPPQTLAGFQVDTSYFFNIPVNSDYVFFVLDISGSMSAPLPKDWEDRNNPSLTKLDRAREELAKTLTALDPEVKFNIILFNDTTHPFVDIPAVATDEVKATANTFFYNMKAEGGTNIFDALNLSLEIKNLGLMDRVGEDLQLDTIFLLSDGVPTTGIVIDPDEILRIVSRANQFSKIKINTIYLGKESSRFMQELAERNFGKYIHIQ